MREFSAAFAAAEMLGIAAEFHEQMNQSIERAGKLVEREAKKEIGEYQDGAGPFVTWPELADDTKDKRVNLGFTENDPGLRTGEMGADIATKVFNHGEHHEANIGSDDDKLVWFELGTVNQPPRSVLGIAAVRNEDKIREIVGEGVVLAMAGGAGIRLVSEGLSDKGVSLDKVDFDVTE